MSVRRDFSSAAARVLVALLGLGVATAAAPSGARAAGDSWGCDEICRLFGGGEPTLPPAPDAPMDIAPTPRTAVPPKSGTPRHAADKAEKPARAAGRACTGDTCPRPAHTATRAKPKPVETAAPVPHAPPHPAPTVAPVLTADLPPPVPPPVAPRAPALIGGGAAILPGHFESAHFSVVQVPAGTPAGPSGITRMRIVRNLVPTP